MKRVHVSLIKPGDYVAGMGVVESVKDYPDDERWAARLTFTDGHSTMCLPHVEVYVSSTDS